MNIKQTWRWFGPDDPISLEEIKQTGVTGIVNALHYLPVGKIWPKKEIKHRKDIIEKAGLEWSVVESLPIHETIKTQSKGFEQYIDNYKTSLHNLSACGIDTVCYNFMPVLDWTRTDLNYRMEDGSTGLRYDHTALAAFDLFVLKREKAKNKYSPSEINTAKKYYDSLNKKQISTFTTTILAGLPGAEEYYSLDKFKAILKTYKHIDQKKYRSNLKLFLTEIIPVAEEEGIKMAIHPDDPPFSILGLPRIVSTESDIKRLINISNSYSNGFTFCTGSLGVRPDNDLVGMIQRLGNKIHFLHLRNIQRQAKQNFYEANHLEGSVDMPKIMLSLLQKQLNRGKEVPMRPDHGHKLTDDSNKNINPGYSFIGRLKGLSELRGLEKGIRKSFSLENDTHP